MAFWATDAADAGADADVDSTEDVLSPEPYSSESQTFAK